MALRLELPAEVQRAFERSRVASPGVTPAARFAQESMEITRRYSDDAVKQAEGQRGEAIKQDAGRPRDDMEAQAGRILTGVQVEAKLKKLNPSLMFEDCVAFPERRLIYRKDRTAGKKLVAAMERGPMPEFSVIDVPKEKWIEPTEAKRGWRTVLGHCIRERVVTPRAVIREFGIPTHDSEQWQKVTL